MVTLMKDTVKLILVLTLICAVSSALLAAVYNTTKEPIAAALELRTASAAAKVMPEGASLPEKKAVAGETFFVARKEGQLAAVAVEGRSKNGYGGEIVLMVGLGADGRHGRHGVCNPERAAEGPRPAGDRRLRSGYRRRPEKARPV